MPVLIALKPFTEWVIAGLKVKALKVSIRSKLLLISAVLFVVPWIGVQYIQDMEDFLRVNQQENLLSRAQVVAAVLQGQAEIFNPEKNISKENHNLKNAFSNTSHIYVRPLKRAIQLDGYIDDGLSYDEKSKRLLSADPASFQYSYYLATYKRYLYIMLKVKDDYIVYRKENSLSLHKNDHVIIKLRNKKDELKTYFIATQSPGWVNAFSVKSRDGEWLSDASELRIKGEWQETAEGYNVEIRLPLSLIGDGFSFYVADVDDENNREIKTILGESDLSDELGSIIIPSEKVESMLKRIVRPASRTWVIDQNYRVLAVAGDIRKQSQSENKLSKNEGGIIRKIIAVFYRLLLQQPAHNFTDELLSASYLRGEVVQSALQGKPATRWRDTPNKQVRILMASYPVVIAGKPVGAIAIEETSNAILILQNKAMEILINLSVLTFLITVIVLLSYATRLSIRISRLRDEAELAISSEGRIQNNIKINKSTDEIGDLSRSFSQMLSRLSEYNRYLESMAGKLSHELRTPITVVRSSLENLQTAENAEARTTYMQRANDGMERLSRILSRMSEASRLEQTLQSETMQQVDIVELIKNCVGGYKIAYPDIDFVIEKNTSNKIYIMGVADLLAQMLDKLISNARDFHAQHAPISIKINEYNNEIKISIINKGKKLPESMRENLFESMVSVRSKSDNEPHLGLGLYIVKMIVMFHKGKVQALDLKNDEGVEIQLCFPITLI